MQISINPATGDTLAEYPLHTQQEVIDAIERAHACFAHYHTMPIEQRAKLVGGMSDILLKNKNEYAKLIALEMGKPFKQSISEVEKCALAARWFAEHGPKFLADEVVETDYSKSYVSFQPMGVVVAVMPWNFPFWQVFRFVFPALLSGNTALLKHASNVGGCALAIESIIREAGFPEDVFKTLLVPGSRAKEIITHPHIRSISLTGSTPAGKSVAALAGAHMKKTVFELGGSDPYLILADADIDHAIETCASSRLNNCGQSCVSAKRLIVVPEVKERFEQGMVEKFKNVVLGDPLDEKTTVGPMSRADLRDELHDQVQRTLAGGATLLHGGMIPDMGGAYYTPTVLTNVAKGMAAYEEELFGPVAVIIPAKDEEDAIRIANDSEFGLGGAVFSKDVARAEKIAREKIYTGACFVNMMVRSDPRMPFGGVKDSGYGRELSAFGLREFVNIKSIIVA